MARGILTQDELDQLNNNPYVIYAKEKSTVPKILDTVLEIYITHFPQQLGEYHTP